MGFNAQSTPQTPQDKRERGEREGGGRERNRKTDRDSAYVYSLLTVRYSDRNERTDVYSSLTDRHSGG